MTFLGDCFAYGSDNDKASRLYTEAAAMHRSLGDTSGLWGVLCNFAEMEFSRGNAERAVEMVQEIFDAAPEERNRLDLLMLDAIQPGWIFAGAETPRRGEGGCANKPSRSTQRRRATKL